MLLVAMPGAPSSVLAPSSKARSPVRSFSGFDLFPSQTRSARGVHVYDLASQHYAVENG